MGYWTLEYDGTEQELADWGIGLEGVSLTRKNQAADELTVRVPGPMDGALAFAYGAAVVLRRDRDLAEGVWSGGSVYFRGKTALPRRSGGAHAEEIEYRFAGPWWDFERLVFQQTWKVFGGYTIPLDPSSDPILNDAASSELFLGQTALGAAQHTGAQITEAVNWAIACGVGVQLGTIDPATNIPIYNVRDVTVSEVIMQMLRWTPDVICWFDYATNPPTFNARKLANLTNVTATVGTDPVASMELVPRYDLQLPAVCLRFKSINDTDGRPWVTLTDQKAPGGASGSELGASVHTVELQGAKMTRVYASIEAVAIAAQSGTEADRIAWWKQKYPLLASAKVDGATLHITSATVKDKDGATVSLAAYPRELTRGQIAAWMSFNVVDVTVKAEAVFDLYKDDDHHIPSEAGKKLELSVRVKATNATSGNFNAVQSYEAAEAVPANLATDIYNAHSALQYEGELVLVGSEVPAGFEMGKRLTLVTGTATYANMLVQQVLEDLGSGKVTLQLGPAAHLGIPDLMELLRVNRYRLIYNMPSSRSTALASANGQVTLGQDTAKENTSSGMGVRESLSVSADAGSGKTAVLTKDAAHEQFVIERLTTATGARDTTHSYVVISATELEALGLTNKAMKVRLLHFKDADNACAPMKMAVLGTEPEADA